MDKMLAAVQNAVVAINNLSKTMQGVLPYVQSTSTSATAGSASLPASPAGFLVATNPVTGATIKIPYYNS